MSVQSSKAMTCACEEGHKDVVRRIVGELPAGAFDVHVDLNYTTGTYTVNCRLWPQPSAAPAGGDVLD